MENLNYKSIIILFMSLTFSIYCHAGEDWANFERYSAENDSIKNNLQHLSPTAVFMGNSITEGWNSKHPEFFHNNNFAGRGISGQTTHQMLLRFREDVINLHPEIVVINGGTNDIAENNHTFNEDITYGNLVSMAELANANGIKVIMTSVLPAEKFKWRASVKDAPEKIKSLNQRIKKYAEDHNYPYADYYEAMISDDIKLNPQFSEDGVHPNIKGYAVMESIISPIIIKVISNSK